MENQAIATMMTYFGSTDHELGTEVDRVRGGTSSKNRLESPLIYIYIYIYIYIQFYIEVDWLVDIMACILMLRLGFASNYKLYL